MPEVENSLEVRRRNVQQQLKDEINLHVKQTECILLIFQVQQLREHSPNKPVVKIAFEVHKFFII